MGSLCRDATHQIRIRSQKIDSKFEIEKSSNMIKKLIGAKNYKYLFWQLFNIAGNVYIVTYKINAYLLIRRKYFIFLKFAYSLSIKIFPFKKHLSQFIDYQSTSQNIIMLSFMCVMMTRHSLYTLMQQLIFLRIS